MKRTLRESLDGAERACRDWETVTLPLSKKARRSGLYSLLEDMKGESRDCLQLTTNFRTMFQDRLPHDTISSHSSRTYHSEDTLDGLLVSALEPSTGEVIFLLQSITNILKKSREWVYTRSNLSRLKSVFSCEDPLEELRAYLEDLKDKVVPLQRYFDDAANRVALRKRNIRFVYPNMSTDFDKFQVSRDSHVHVLNALEPAISCTSYRWYLKLDFGFPSVAGNSFSSDACYVILRVSSLECDIWRIRIKARSRSPTAKSAPVQSSPSSLKVSKRSVEVITTATKDDSLPTDNAQPISLDSGNVGRVLCAELGKRKEKGAESHVLAFKDRNEETFDMFAIWSPQEIRATQELRNILQLQQARLDRRQYRLDISRLAYLLAKSLLLLVRLDCYKEDDKWKKEDVLLLDEKTDELASQKTENSTHALPGTTFISIVPESRAKDSLHKSVTPQRSPKSQAPNATLFALGVLLLELAFGKPIEDLATKDEQDKGQITAKLTAERLEKGDQVLTLMGRLYANVVYRCLSGNFGTGGRDLRSEGLQEAFWEDAVLQLWRCYSVASGDL